MKIVTCTLPNASTEIDGVKFDESPEGMVSEPVADDVAARFATIKGYAVADAPNPDAGAQKDGSSDQDAGTQKAGKKAKE